MRSLIVTGIVVAVLIGSVTRGWAHSADSTASLTEPISPPESAHLPAPVQPLSTADLDAWIGGLMSFALNRADIAGAVVVVVKDGAVLWQKGYGYADSANQRAVDPETTLFRAASISKLFTWTAVMQQVELGNIDLDQDINAYLNFNIPPFRGRPITMRNLMTHTAGFQESLKDIRVTDSTAVLPLGEFLERQIPSRVYPPGEVPSYSNYGASLAGYIVERVSAHSFDDYMDQFIFSPLSMTHSTFRQPLPAQLRSAMSSGYKLGSGAAQPYEMGGLVPAAGLTVTASDMAHFMIAHLQDGEYNGRRILQPATAVMMHDTPSTIISPELDRMLLGFYEMNRNGHRIIGHEGDTPLFHSALELFLDEHVGVFLSLNSLGRDHGAYAVRTGFLDGFADRYFPASWAPRAAGPVQPDVAKADSATVSGHYDSSRREDTTFASLLNLILQVNITTDEAGHLIASPVTGLGDQPRPFEEVARFAWREIGGQDRLVAKVVAGKVVMWAEDGDSPYMVYTPTPVWRDAAWLIPALGLSLSALLLSAILGPIAAIVRRRMNASVARQGRAAQVYRWARVLETGALCLMIAWLVTVGIMASKFYVSSSLVPWIFALHALSIVTFPLAAAVSVWNGCLTCKTTSPVRNAFTWARDSFLALSSLNLLWVALVFRLIGIGVAF